MSRARTVFLGRCFAVVGSVCLLGLLAPLAVLLPFAYRVAGQFAEVGRAGATQEPVSTGLGEPSLLTTTGIGSGLGLLGVLLVGVAVCEFRFAAPWLHRVLRVGVVCLLLVFPAGTLVALVLLLILRRYAQLSARPAVV